MTASPGAFYATAMAAGRWTTALRAFGHTAADYYAAYVLDADGNNIEAVCHQAQPSTPRSSRGNLPSPGYSASPFSEPPPARTMFLQDVVRVVLRLDLREAVVVVAVGRLHPLLPSSIMKLT